jgi:flagellar biosynthesis/type III secretory pathway chaperone
VDAALTRDTLGRLLAEENAALSEFETLLDREYGALSRRDIDELESLADTRQASILRLLKIEEERRSVCIRHRSQRSRQAHRLVRPFPHARPSLR